MDWRTTAGRQLCQVGGTATTRLAVQVQGKQHLARLTWSTLALRTSKRLGGVAAAHLCCRRVCRTIHLLNIELAQDVLGWQSGWPRTTLPSLVGGTSMALQHRQDRPFRCPEMTCLQELAL